MTDYARHGSVPRVEDATPIPDRHHETRSDPPPLTCAQYHAAVIDLRQYRSHHEDEHRALDLVIRATHDRLGDLRDPQPYTFAAAISSLVAHQMDQDRRMVSDPPRAEMISVTDETVEVHGGKRTNVSIQRGRRSLTAADYRQIAMGIALMLGAAFEVLRSIHVIK